MADFVSKKLQVFVSSTFQDLRKERQAAVEAILTAGHIPAGMELFTAGDESQMDVIKQWIDESDVYLLILGGRYGSVEPVSGKSYTHLEYEYALSTHKPHFACVINDGGLKARTQQDQDLYIEQRYVAELDQFRKIVLEKVSRFWDDPRDIKLAILETLSAFSKKHELLGWVRPHAEGNLPAITDEIARLSKENAELREQLGLTDLNPMIAGVPFQRVKYFLDKVEGCQFLLLEETNIKDGVYYYKEASLNRLLSQFELYNLISYSFSGDRVFVRFTPEGLLFIDTLKLHEFLDAQEE